jgi:hypothetical protein
MSVNLAEAIQTKHVITFWLVAHATKGAPVSHCLVRLKHRTGEYFGAGLTLGGKGIDYFYASL